MLARRVLVAGLFVVALGGCGSRVQVSPGFGPGPRGAPSGTPVTSSGNPMEAISDCGQLRSSVDASEQAARVAQSPYRERALDIAQLARDRMAELGC
jgi:hypothetical protein